jgi:clan AA aspartic protease
MNGHVDEKKRALIGVRLAAPAGESFVQCWAWIDTAFNGSLVLPKSIVDQLQLPIESSAEAVLADGSKVAMETYGCKVEWFGRSYDTQVVTNDGEYALLGTILLTGRRLEIDYGSGTVTIE